MKKKERIIYLISVFFLILLILIFSQLNFKQVLATNSSSSNQANLTIWDDTDSESRYSGMNFNFFANFTNSSAYPINSSNGNGNCNISYNSTGTFGDWETMSFNSSSMFWEGNETFNYKGVWRFRANCTSDYGNILLLDNFTISNTVPNISVDHGGMYIDLDLNKYNTDWWPCTEDTVCYYNFSANVSDSDINDNWTFNYSTSSNTTLANFSMNIASGVLTINITDTAFTGQKQIELNVRDTESQSIAGLLRVNVTPVNDPPIFTALPGMTSNVTEDSWFNFSVNITDEENNTPFYYNLTFNDCDLASWSTRTNCSIFGINSSTGEISFLPTNDDVGLYNITFNVTDSGSPNASNATTVIFQVINLNDAPLFTYVCDNEREATEDSEFKCWINASDVDEDNNFTFSSNYSWFTFNNSATSITINTTNGIANASVKFTPNDSAVGNRSINITLVDSAASSNSTNMFFLVNNVHDSPNISIDNITCYTNVACVNYAYADDDDLLIPGDGESVYNENLTFADNSTLFSISKISEDTGLINFTPTNSDSDNYIISINVTDASSRVAYALFNLTIENNTFPEWNVSKEYNLSLTEDSNFYLNLSTYATDAENDTLTFYSNYSNDQFPLFNLTSYGLLNFTPEDLDVNFHIIEVKVSDDKGNSSTVFTFNVSNINDVPILMNVSNIITQENNLTEIYFYVRDDDLLIQNESSYNESLSFTEIITNLTGEYRDLFDITLVNTTANKTWALITFTPYNDDAGNYSINITVEDMANLSDSIVFNLSIEDLQNEPVLSEIGVQSAGVDILFTKNITAVDNDSDNLTFFSNTSWFTFNNSATSITVVPSNKTAIATINFTLNSSKAGTYKIRINVSDGLTNDTEDFTFKVYDTPQIQAVTCQNVSENQTFYCTVFATQTVNEALNCSIIINGRSNTSSCNPSTLTRLNITTNFTDEGVQNATLNFSNPFFSNSTLKLVNISHSDAPPSFSGTIDNITVAGSSTTLDLLDYFSDVDHDDSRYNESINITWTQYDTGLVELPSPTISASIVDYIMTLSSSSNVSEYFLIKAIDSDNSSLNASSNYFFVNFSITGSNESESSGGGGASAPQRISLKILVPDPVKINAVGNITLPIKVLNDGAVVLNTISISAITKRERITLAFNTTSVASLPINHTETFYLTIIANAPEVRDMETFSIEAIAQSNSPKANDSAELLVTLLEIDRENRIKAEQKNILLKEFLTNNQECLELMELHTAAVGAFQKANYNESLRIAEQAMQACKKIIGSKEPGILNVLGMDKTKIVIMALLFLILLLVALSLYYNQRRSKKSR